MIHNSVQAKARSTLRLFTGIAIPADVNSRLDGLIERLKPLARIRWSPPSNFHITTKFIGAWPQDRLEEMKAALAELRGSGVFRIVIRGLGFYPNARRPRIFLAGVEGGEALVRLAAGADRICAKLGVQAEKKPYSPHLTLARIDPPARLEALHEALAQEALTKTSSEFGEFEATVLHLYLSQPGRGGSVYTSLAEFAL